MNQEGKSHPADPKRKVDPEKPRPTPNEFRGAAERKIRKYQRKGLCLREAVGCAIWDHHFDILSEFVIPSSERDEECLRNAVEGYGLFLLADVMKAGFLSEKEMLSEKASQLLWENFLSWLRSEEGKVIDRFPFGKISSVESNQKLLDAYFMLQAKERKEGRSFENDWAIDSFRSKKRLVEEIFQALCQTNSTKIYRGRGNGRFSLEASAVRDQIRKTFLWPKPKTVIAGKQGEEILDREGDLSDAKALDAAMESKEGKACLLACKEAKARFGEKVVTAVIAWQLGGSSLDEISKDHGIQREKIRNARQWIWKRCREIYEA